MIRNPFKHHRFPPQFLLLAVRWYCRYPLSYVWGLFFAFHLLALGFLIYKSSFFPKVIGILMIIGSFGYATESVASITFVDNAITTFTVIAFLVIAVVSELSFTFWLLIKGINLNEWNAKTSISRVAGGHR